MKVYSGGRSKAVLAAATSFLGTALTLAACVGDTASAVDDASTGGDATSSPDGAVAASDASGSGSVDGGGTAADAAPSCGSPGMVCCTAGTACTGSSTCTSGVCECSAGKTICGASCVDTQGDGKHCGRCAHGCLGGTCTTGKCDPVTVVPGQPAVSGLVVDATHVYWTRGVSGAGSVAGGVFTVNMDGTGVTNLTPLATTSVYFQGPSVGGGQVYFTSGSTVNRCPLPTCAGGPVAVATAQQAPSMTAVDVAGGRLYWTNGTPYNQSTGGAVMTVPLAGGAPQRVVAADQPDPEGIVIANNQVYWLNAGHWVNDNFQYDTSVKRAPLGVNGAETLVASDNVHANNSGLAVDALSAYFGGGSPSALLSSPVTGGGAPSRFGGQGSTITAILTDGTNVYWSEVGGTNGIYMCPRTGCGAAPITVVAGQGANAMAQDAVSIWYGAGEIRRVAK